MKYIIFSLLLVVSTSATNVKFIDCGSVLAKDIAVTVEPCETQPCQLKQGGNYTVGITFTPDPASKNIKVSIHGVIDGIPVPFPFDHPDACKDSGITCPLTSGQPAKYVQTLPILTSYPAIKVLVKWQLTDTDANKDLVCIEMPVAIIKGASNHREKAVSSHWYED